MPSTYYVVVQKTVQSKAAEPPGQNMTVTMVTSKRDVKKKRKREKRKKVHMILPGLTKFTKIPRSSWRAGGEEPAWE